MRYAYFIGGPFDLTKQHIPDQTDPVMTMWTGPNVPVSRWEPSTDRQIDIEHHHYQLIFKTETVSIYSYVNKRD